MKNVHFRSDKNSWETPHWLFAILDGLYKFTLDPCATNGNKKCDRYYDLHQDGLSKDWEHERVFINPPYGRDIGKWVKKAHDLKNGVAVLLLPSRTDTRWWHDYVMNANKVWLIKGRITFEGGKSSAPFPSAIVIFDRDGSMYYEVADQFVTFNREVFTGINT